MPIVLIISFLMIQPVRGPVTECRVSVELVDVSWSLLSYTEVRLRDERIGATQTARSDESGRARFCSVLRRRSLLVHDYCRRGRLGIQDGDLVQPPVSF